MSSEASSDQSYVRNGVGYDEVYLSSQDDPSTSSDERVPSFNSSSTEGDEDVNMNGLKDDSSDQNIANAEPITQSVIGPNGLREFILLPLWTVNDFRSTIKQKQFDTLKEKFQIPVNIPICLPYKSEKCYYKGADDVGVYEQMLKVGLRFPLSTLHRCLLQYLGLVVTQISPNAWRVFLSAEVLYGVLSKEARRMTVEEFFHCYRPSEIFQSRGMYSFLPRKPSLRPVCETPDSNRNWKSRCFFLEGDD